MWGEHGTRRSTDKSRVATCSNTVKADGYAWWDIAAYTSRPGGAT